MIKLTSTYTMVIDGSSVPLCSATVEVDPAHTAKAVSDLKAIWPPGALTKTVDAALAKHEATTAASQPSMGIEGEQDDDAPG